MEESTDLIQFLLQLHLNPVEWDEGGIPNREGWFRIFHPGRMIMQSRCGREARDSEQVNDWANLADEQRWK